MKKRTKIIIGLALGACVLVGAASVAGVLDDAIIKIETMLGMEVEEASSDYVPPEGATQVTGMVLTAYGNEITIQLAADSSSSTQGSMGMSEGMAEGEMSEGMSEGGMSERGEMSGEGMTEGELPEGMTEGEAPEGVSEGGMSERGEMSGEGMAEGEMSEGMSESGMSSQGGMSAQGGTSDAAQSVPTDTAASADSTTSAMPEMSSEMSEISGGMSGEMSEMSGGMGSDSAMGGEMSGMGGDSAMGGMDTTASISLTLSDETQLFVIPTGTIVEYYGFEMTFSQIEAEQYITITLSAEGNILYVEVLG